MNEDALAWLDENWNQATLPNNHWIAVTTNGLLGFSEGFDSVMELEDLRGLNLNDVVFCFVTFDIWQ